MAKTFTDEKLKKELDTLFASYIKQSDRLACLGISQANESFNMTVASRAPKNKHYSGSKSLSYLVNQAVLQKNQGHRYLSLV